MITIIIVSLTLAVLYWYGTKTYKYWENKGIKHDKPFLFVGNNARNFFGHKSVTQLADEVYWKYPKEKVVGFYRALRPELVIRDPDLAKRVLTTDFMHFHARGVSPHKRIDPLNQNVLIADGDMWRLLRQRITPAFTSGKLKAMFPLIVERAGKLQANIVDAASKGRVMDARDTMARFTTDFIGACGFGLDTNALTEENSPFRKLGYKIFNKPLKQYIITVLKFMFPNLMQYVKTRADLEEDVFPLVNGILRARNYQPTERNDFMDLLLEAKAKGTMVGESIENFNPDGSPEIARMEFDDVMIAAQALVFFAAGFETSSSTTSYTLHQLAFNADKQKKAQEEVDRVLAKYDNKLCYDAIREMKYLECCFKESMRIFPSVGFITRQSVGQYTFPEIDLTIDKGVQVFIPVQAMQNDPQYFENPEEFRPERFLPEEFDLKNKSIFLPFGLGPRACIGERLGLMQSLAGLAAVLSCSSVEPAPTTLKYPEINPTSLFVQAVKGGLPLMFRVRDKTVKYVKFDNPHWGRVLNYALLALSRGGLCPAVGQI